MISVEYKLTPQTHWGELYPAQASMIDSIPSTMFFACDNFKKNPGNYFQLVRNHRQRLEITAECGRNREFIMGAHAE